MLKEKKTQIIDKIAEDLSRSDVIIATDYRGLTAKQMAEVRNALAKANTEYHVVKNTLTRFAANKVGKGQLVAMVEGPIALAFGQGDVVATAKAVDWCIKSADFPLQIKWGLLGERILTVEEVVSLANLPSSGILVSQLIGRLRAPIVNLHNILAFPLQGLLNVLQSKAQKCNE